MWSSFQFNLTFVMTVMVYRLLKFRIMKKYEFEVLTIISNFEAMEQQINNDQFTKRTKIYTYVSAITFFKIKLFSDDMIRFLYLNTLSFSVKIVNIEWLSNKNIEEVCIFYYHDFEFSKELIDAKPKTFETLLKSKSLRIKDSKLPWKTVLKDSIGLQWSFKVSHTLQSKTHKCSAS